MPSLKHGRFRVRDGSLFERVFAKGGERNIGTHKKSLSGLQILSAQVRQKARCLIRDENLSIQGTEVAKERNWLFGPGK